MSFAQGLMAGTALGNSIRDRRERKLNRAEDIKLALERDERQKAYEQQMKVQQLKDEFAKMEKGGQIDLERLRETLNGQRGLQADSHAFSAGQNELNRGHAAAEAEKNRSFQAGEASTNRSWQSSEAAQDRGQRQQQIMNQLRIAEAEQVFRNNQFASKPDPSKTAEVRKILDDGSTASYHVPLSDINQPPRESYASPYAKAIAEAERELADQQIQMSEGDNRTAFGFSRKGIASAQKNRWLHLKALELEDKVKKGFLTREQANNEAARLKGM
ncbi:MAG: hypothetical protein JNJ82_05315 [Opitutaceae bacterium]|nr:hypothetical protein [Opitutaceae bacterium]